MSEKVKIQHYVPRFYLRRFSVEPGSKAIYCFDKQTRASFLTGVNAIAAEKYFHDLPSDIDQTVEKTLADYEGKWAQATGELVDKKNVGLVDAATREGLAYFVAAQAMRTREQREVMLDVIRQLEDRFGEEMSAALRAQVEAAKEPNATKAAHLAFLNRVLEIATILLSLRWAVLENTTDAPIWTSDHPVVRHNPVDHGFYGNLGFLCRGIQIFLPLTPSLCLVICDPEHYKSIPPWYRVKDPANILWLNHLQVILCTRFVFSSTDDFDLAQRALSDQPDIGDPLRPRLKVT